MKVETTTKLFGTPSITGVKDYLLDAYPALKANNDLLDSLSDDIQQTSQYIADKAVDYGFKNGLVIGAGATAVIAISVTAASMFHKYKGKLIKSK